MEYEFSMMKQEQAEDIACNWHYKGDYSFYNMEADREDLAEFLDPKARGNGTFAVTRDSEWVAFLSVDEVSDDIVEIGLGMKPAWTGKGLGFGFLKAAVGFVRSKYASKKIILSVATFNHRAIKVYRKAGFKDVVTYMQDTNGSTYEFLKMEYDILDSTEKE